MVKSLNALWLASSKRASQWLDCSVVQR